MIDQAWAELIERADEHRITIPGLDVNLSLFTITFGLYLKTRGERIANVDPFGPSGFTLVIVRPKSHGKAVAYEPVGSVIVTQANHEGTEWVHASIARRRDPDYADLVALKEATWGPDGYAYQVFPARAEHVNIHEHALHLWGRASGERVLPAFGASGSI